jgi:translation initiation factor IF-2
MSPEGPETVATEERSKSARTQARKSAPKAIVLPPTLTVKRLAELTQISPIDTIKQLMRNGIMVSLNQVIDYEVATLVTSAFSVRTRPGDTSQAAATGTSNDDGVDPSKLVGRPPVVTILGHVDHGKTTLLDTIRRSRVAAGEIGSITQHIGAYQVTYNDKKITFLDTPGHEAFTAIRARGASVTDIAILVVAADDGVMPQTVEALDHAKAANVPILVAINKMDRPDADPDRVKRQLGDNGLILEEWGGDVITAAISAELGDGIDDLLENLLAVAEIADLKADPDRPASGVVIEAKLDRNRGPLATVLVQSGTLKVGDHVLTRTSWGRVKALANDMGKRVKEAPPTTPVEMMGFGSLPEAGDMFEVVPDEKTARDSVKARMQEKEADRSSSRAMTLEEIHTRIDSGEVKELNLVIKADVQGSVEAATLALQRLDDERVKVRILHAASGTITESDVLLASASQAIIIGFGTTTQPGVERLAERERVEIRNYGIIYHLVEDIEKALQGILETIYEEVVHGHAAIRTVFSIGRRGQKIAGCMITDGRVSRGSMVRVLRRGQAIHDGTISSLRHFKEEVTEMASGFECGIGLGGYNNLEEGDVLEIYRRERARR